jgi:tripartite-type tricarboxylate transporter receptor subunit TctC
MALDSIFTVNPYAYDKLPYDPAHGFEPVSLMTTQAQWYAARPGLNVRSMQELLAEVKKRPGQLNYGYGSPPGQLSAELLKSLTGAQMNMIAYKGAAAAVLAALRGEVDVIGADLAPMVQHVKAGKLVALGQTGVERSPLFPDVQTMQEQGLKGFEALAWFGAFAPAGTPRDIIAKMNSELVAVLGDQQVQAQILKLGYQAASSSPEALGARVKADAEKWGHLIRTANIKLS